MKIIRTTDIQVNNWSGGTTSELYIYPQNSNYKNLDFKFRLSKATIEVNESTFTPLPKVKRKLMLLEGELELIHENHHAIKLKPLEYDTFSGSWNTRSIGIATDFNLMMLGNTKGNYFTYDTKNKLKATIDNLVDYCIFYVVNGTLTYNENLINKGELIIFDSNDSTKVKFELSEQSKVINIQISL